MAQQPVFYDPRQARWKRLRRIFDLAALAFTFLVIFFIYTALRSERLPDLLLPIQKRPYHALKEKEKEKAKEHRRLAALHRGHRKSKSAPSQVKLNAEEGIRAAFYVPWDAASFSSLREYARQIDLLFPTWLQVLTPDGRLQSVDEQTNKLFNVVQGVTVRSVDDKVMPFVKSEDTGMEVFPVVQNFDGTDWIDISAFLNDPDARARFRGQGDAFLASDKFRGLMIDFEDFLQKAQPGYMALLSALSGDLHANGMNRYVSVQKPKHGALPPGAKDTNVSVQDAWLTARDSEADMDFDGDALNPHISYLDEDNRQHEVWFLDAVTALNEMRAAQLLGIKTFA